MDERYKRGKIYKLVSSQTDKIYIGSTIQLLCQRKAKHKCNPSKSRELICYEDCEIVLIKKFPCNCKKELEREEGNIIEQNLDKCVNTYIPRRTKEEIKPKKAIWNKKYCQSEKGKIKRKENYELKKDEINKKRRETIDRDKKAISDKNYREKNKDKMYYCECCNRSVKYLSKNKHFKTQIHLSNIAL